MTRGYARFVQRDRVDSHIFTDPGIFEAEMERIFESGWVFVAHEGEIPENGDYVTRVLGRQPVIAVRSDGEVRVLLNRCRHRGTALCVQDRGNARFFRCPYHGWTYANSGALVGVPYPTAYGPEFDKADFGLTPVPAVAEHRGFVFASLRPPTISLDDWLGPRVREVLDAFTDGSPTGRLVVRSGAHQTAFNGNWKYVGMDGYHVNFTHRSLVALGEHRGELVGGQDHEDRSPGRAWDFGNGHCRLDKDYGDDYAAGVLAKLRKVSGGEEYIAALEANLGVRAAGVLVLGRDPHLGVWPNLQLIGSHIRVIRPVAPNRTIVTLHATQLDGAPEAVNEERLRLHESQFGVAGFIQPDDSELFERNQLGLQARVDPWLYLGRGLARETTNDDGSVFGHVTDETTQRGQMKMWLRQMTRDGDARAGEEDRP